MKYLTRLGWIGFFLLVLFLGSCATAPESPPEPEKQEQALETEPEPEQSEEVVEESVEKETEEVEEEKSFSDEEKEALATSRELTMKAKEAADEVFAPKAATEPYGEGEAAFAEAEAAKAALKYEAALTAY